MKKQIGVVIILLATSISAFAERDIEVDISGQAINQFIETKSSLHNIQITDFEYLMNPQPLNLKNILLEKKSEMKDIVDVYRVNIQNENG